MRFTPEEAERRLPVVIVRPGLPDLPGLLVYAPPPEGTLRPDGHAYSQRAKVLLASGRHLRVKPEFLQRIPK